MFSIIGDTRTHEHESITEFRKRKVGGLWNVIRNDFILTQNCKWEKSTFVVLYHAITRRI